MCLVAEDTEMLEMQHKQIVEAHAASTVDGLQTVDNSSPPSSPSTSRSDFPAVALSPELGQTSPARSADADSDRAADRRALDRKQIRPLSYYIALTKRLK